MNLIKKTFLILISLIAINAHALVLVEPHLGLNISGTGHDSAIPAKTFLYGGGQYGLKLGAQYLNAMAGIDYNHSSFEQMTSGYKNKFSRTEWGIFLGYNFPAIARFWGTYFFSNSANAESASGLIPQNAKYEGHTFELGAGYAGISYCSINFAYRFVTLTKYIASGSTSSLTGSTEVNNNEIVLGVSAPFDFF